MAAAVRPSRGRVPDDMRNKLLFTGYDAVAL
jgi:hypothetical protein